jgi:beta-lactamase regulating signal transducer with metallopeptidase domain
MNHFSYSFCVTLFHSLWQSGLLLLIYAALKITPGKASTSYKRNLLFFLLGAQLIVSVLTFYIYYSGIQHAFTNLISSKPGTSEFLQQAAPWLFFMYAIVILVKSGRLLVGWISFRKNYLQHIEKPFAELKVFTQLKAFEFGIKRKVTIWFSHMVTTPLTFGFFRPVILMPVALVNNISTKEAESLIIHELTHIRNHDYLLNWLLVIVNTVYFFNPFVLILSRQIKLQRELSCDLQVLQFNYPGINYADTLLKAARGTTSHNLFQLGAAFSNQNLLKRIRFFTEEKNLEPGKKHQPVFSLAGIAGFFLLSLLTTLQLKNHQPEIKTSLSSIQIPEGYTENKLPFTVISKTNSTPARALHPVIEKTATLNLASVTKRQQKQTATDNLNLEESAELETIEENYAYPVAAFEPASSKELVIREESSATGETITKSYRMTLKDGEWVPTLLWVLTERKPVEADSCKIPAVFIPARQ